MVVRKFELKDLKQCFELLNQLYKNKIEYVIFSEKYKENLENNLFYGIVAEENEKIIGVLTARVINRLVKARNILFVDDLIIDQNYRTHGIGKRLLQNAIDYATQKDCETIELKCYITNKNAHKFYENNGLEKSHYTFKKYLNKD